MDYEMKWLGGYRKKVMHTTTHITIPVVMVFLTAFSGECPLWTGWIPATLFTVPWGIPGGSGVLLFILALPAPGPAGGEVPAIDSKGGGRFKPCFRGGGGSGGGDAGGG